VPPSRLFQCAAKCLNRLVEAGPAGGFRPSSAEPGMVVQVRCVVLVLASQHAVSTDFELSNIASNLRQQRSPLVSGRWLGMMPARSVEAWALPCVLGAQARMVV